MMAHRLVIAFVLLVVTIGFVNLPLPLANASQGPTVSNAVIIYHVTPPSPLRAPPSGETASIQMPSGAQLYIYGFVTGGTFPSWGFKYGQSASVTNQVGTVVASLAVTPNSTNRFQTETGMQSLGGVSVTGYSSYASSYQSNRASGAQDVSETFSVRSSGSLVVIFALGGLQGCMSLSGLPGVQTDAPSSHSTGNSTRPGITIAHVYLDTGTYTVTAHFRCSASMIANSIYPDRQADLIGVFVFAPGKT